MVTLAFLCGHVCLQAKGMKKQIIDEFMSNNKFLLVPRLVNQKLFDELCPVKQFHRRRKYENLILRRLLAQFAKLVWIC